MGRLMWTRGGVFGGSGGGCEGRGGVGWGEWEFGGRIVDIWLRVEGWKFGGRVERDGQRPLEGVAVWPGCKPGGTAYPRKKGSKPGRADGDRTGGRRTTRKSLLRNFLFAVDIVPKLW